MTSSIDSRYPARWYDGRTASGADAEVAVVAGSLLARVGEREFRIPMSDVRTSAPVAGVPLRLGIPDGGVFVLADPGIDPRALGAAAPQGFVHGLERNPVVVVLALIAVVIIAILAYRTAIPWIAGKVADRVPIRAEAQLGAATLASLDRFLFTPSKLPAARRAEIQMRFDRLANLSQLPEKPELAFRSDERLIANAITLPGGTVVVTDELVKRLESPDEVAAVMAHEIGHIAHRHTMRHLLEKSASGLILGAVVGDVSGIGSLAAAAPALLVGLQYSRANEEEADDYALALLPRDGLSPSLLADALETLASPDCPEEDAGDKDDAMACSRARGGRAEPPAYLSTHPDTLSRIERARAAH